MAERSNEQTEGRIAAADHSRLQTRRKGDELAYIPFPMALAARHMEDAARPRGRRVVAPSFDLRCSCPRGFRVGSGHRRRRHRTGGSFSGGHHTGGFVSVVQSTELRPERLYFQSHHATERDPGDGQLDSNPTGLEPVRNSALCAAVRARHIWFESQPPQLSGWLLHHLGGPPPPPPPSPHPKGP